MEESSLKSNIIFDHHSIIGCGFQMQTDIISGNSIKMAPACFV
jgi:hypothetical protein